MKGSISSNAVDRFKSKGTRSSLKGHSKRTRWALEGHLGTQGTYALGNLRHWGTRRVL